MSSHQDNKNSKGVEDVIGAGDGKLSSIFDVCNLHLEVINHESKPPWTDSQAFLWKVKLKAKSVGVFCRPISKELHILVIGVGLSPCPHHKRVVNCTDEWIRRQVRLGDSYLYSRIRYFSQTILDWQNNEVLRGSVKMNNYPRNKEKVWLSHLKVQEGRSN